MKFILIKQGASVPQREMNSQTAQLGGIQPNSL